MFPPKSFADSSPLVCLRSQCLALLKTLLYSLGELDLPYAATKYLIKDLCLKTSTLVFCTTSSSCKIHSIEMEPFNVLIIDEAAQLRECVSVIPLNLPGLKHAILVSDEAGFGRSLFERLSSLGHSKLMLNVQYRMHPAISYFPNVSFYRGQVQDAANNLIYTVWRSTGKKLSIGIISPYTAQVVTIKDTIGRKYDNLNGFAIKAKSIHGFQGGEEDIIIISTVRFNSSGSIGFMNSLQRTNVALTSTRAWYGQDLSNLKLTKELDQLDDLLNADSIVFKSQRWKVLLSDNFKRSFKNLVTSRMKKAVLNLLIKLAGGWRPKSKGVDLVCESSSQIVKQFKVEGANTELRILESKKLFENLLKEKNELIAGWLSEQSALELQWSVENYFRKNWINLMICSMQIASYSKVKDERSNFCTHAGVLRLAQSVIDILCHYFPQSIDALAPETNLIYGEASVLLLLKPGSDILAGRWRPKSKGVDLVCESSSQIVKQFKVEGANTELRILESKKLFENLLKEKNELIAGWLSEQSALEKIIEGKVAILSEVKCSVDKVMGCLTWMPLEKIIQELEKIQEGDTVEFEAETEKNLIYTVWRSTGKKLSIGIISPYTAQVVTIKDTIGRKYDNLNGFAIKAKSIHGFQGGEEDIIIISTVRFNSSGSIGFMNSLQRTNVALTSTGHGIVCGFWEMKGHYLIAIEFGKDWF
nr:uncharacterized protein LOC109161799 isoform X1 [Ipomoea trifida]